MKSQKAIPVISVLLAVIVAFSCTVSVFAAGSLKIVTQPSRRSFYQGIDWSYNTKTKAISVIGSLDVTGTVLSDGKNTVSYTVGKWPNMYAKNDASAWKEGENVIRIYCDDLDSYATTTVNFVGIKSISLVTPPDKTELILNEDWKLTVIGDCDVQSIDLTGLTLKAVYKDGTVKTVSYNDNKLIGWAVDEETDLFVQGKNTVYATFCGLSVPFEISLVKESTYKTGDVSRDGAINSFDALLVLRHSVGQITLNSVERKLADTDKSGTINSSDALAILQYSVGIKKSF